MRVRIPSWLVAGAVAVAVCAGPLACANQNDTQVMPPVVEGMLDTTPPAYDDGTTQIYQVSTPVVLPMRRPGSGERPGGQVAPYPRAPFDLASDTRITLRFTLTNLEDKERVVELLVDPWNEFVRYQPGFVIGEETTTPNFSGIDRFFVLPPKARVEGIITPDDMVELATDLATAMQVQKATIPATSQFAGPALYNRAFNIQNRSSQFDPVLAPYIPQTIAGLVGFDLGLRTAEPAKLAVELVVDVTDMNGDRVLKEGDDPNNKIGRPGTILSPPPPPAPAP